MKKAKDEECSVLVNKDIPFSIKVFYKQIEMATQIIDQPLIILLIIDYIKKLKFNNMAVLEDFYSIIQNPELSIPPEHKAFFPEFKRIGDNIVREYERSSSLVAGSSEIEGSDFKNDALMLGKKVKRFGKEKLLPFLSDSIETALKIETLHSPPSGSGEFAFAVVTQVLSALWKSINADTKKALWIGIKERLGIERYMPIQQYEVLRKFHENSSLEKENFPRSSKFEILNGEVFVEVSDFSKWIENKDKNKKNEDEKTKQSQQEGEEYQKLHILFNFVVEDYENIIRLFINIGFGRGRAGKLLNLLNAEIEKFFKENIEVKILNVPPRIQRTYILMQSAKLAIVMAINTALAGIRILPHEKPYETIRRIFLDEKSDLAVALNKTRKSILHKFINPLKESITKLDREPEANLITISFSIFILLNGKPVHSLLSDEERLYFLTNQLGLFYDCAKEPLVGLNRLFIFEEFEATGNPNAGFYMVGMSREKVAVLLLSQEDNVLARQELAEEIVEEIIRGTADMKAVPAIQKLLSQKHDKRIRAELLLRCADIVVYREYVNSLKRNARLGFISIKILIKYVNILFNLYVWGKELQKPNEVKLIDSCTFDRPAKSLHFLYQGSYTHFSLLIEYASENIPRRQQGQDLKGLLPEKKDVEGIKLTAEFLMQQKNAFNLWSSIKRKHQEATQADDIKKQQDDFAQRLYKVAAQQGFDYDDVPDDNNCQFHAIATQLALHAAELRIKGFAGLASLTHEDLRKRAVRLIAFNKGQFRDHVAGNDIDAYIDRMSKIGEWGDQLTLLALSQALNVNIHLLHADGNIIRFPQPANANALTTLHIGFNGFNHYWSLKVKQVLNAAGMFQLGGNAVRGNSRDAAEAASAAAALRQ